MLITPANSLITVAADGEWPHFERTLGKKWRLVQTGVGKLDTVTTILTEHYKEPFAVLVNLGSAGANDPKLKIGEILQATKLEERDNPFGHGPLTLPKLKSSKMKTAVLGTGDNFVEGDACPPRTIQLVDMEGYAAARIAGVLNCECLILKIVSDYCTSFQDWEQNVAINSQKLAKFFAENEFKI